MSHLLVGQSLGAIIAALHVSHKHFFLFGNLFVDAFAGFFGLLFAIVFTILLFHLNSFAFGLSQADTFCGVGNPDLGTIFLDFPFLFALIDIVVRTLVFIYVPCLNITATNLATEREKDKKEGLFLSVYFYLHKCFFTFFPKPFFLDNFKLVFVF